MNIANSPSVNTAVASASQAPKADSVHILVLRKALDTQAAGALALLDAIPKQPPLATEGSLGRNINTYA